MIIPSLDWLFLDYSISLLPSGCLRLFHLFVIRKTIFHLSGFHYSQPRRRPHRNSIQIHGLELMSLSVLYGLRKLRVVLGTRVLHAAAVCSVRGSLSPLDYSMPIVLMMHYSASITSLASPDPVFTAFLTLALERSPPPSSGFTLSKGPPQQPPPHPLTHFVRSKSSSLAYRLAFVIFIYTHIIDYTSTRL